MRCSIEQVHESVARAACDGNCRRGVISDPRIVGIHATDNRDSREQDEFGYLPAIGESFDHQGWRFEVIDLDGRRVHHVGLPYHWGYNGIVRGDVVNDLIAMSEEPNVRIFESKGLSCNVVKA